MSDDPYDFEIALPAAASDRSGSQRRRQSSSDGDGFDGNDSSDSLSNGSGISSGNEHETRYQASSSIRGPVMASKSEPSSGSALDRAKNFLSKYSGVPTKNLPASKVPLRVNLDSDDEDFSLDSSSGDEKVSAGDKSKSAVEREVVTSFAEEHDSLQDFGRAAVNSAQIQANSDEEYQGTSNESSEGGNRIDATLHLSNARQATTSSRQRDDIHTSSQRDDSIESFHSGSEEVSNGLVPPIHKPAQERTTPDPDNSSESGDDYNESFHDESLASQSDLMMNVTNTTVAVKSNSPTHVAFAESEAYEEDAFEEEESFKATQLPGGNVAPAITSNVIVNASNEGAFDYSMDFSEDESEARPSQTLVTASLHKDPSLHTIPDPNSTNNESSGRDGDDSEKSVFLNSEGGEENTIQSSKSQTNATHLDEGKQLEDPKGLRVPLQSSTRSTVQDCEDLPTVTYNSSNAKSGGNNAETSDISELPRLESGNSATAPSDNVAFTPYSKPKARPQITIVREYDQDSRQPVQTRDASTQFTGNHAAIQADLVTEGMHNIFAKASPENSRTSALDSPPYLGKTEKPTNRSDLDGLQTGLQTPPQEVPPPPPVSSLLGSSMYSFEAIKLHAGGPTSIYKQQLLALQDQILQKKRETERIVQDRMSFQYSSLRGTERFIAARRSQKLELWEALMRVDPTLDERKAREVARLAQTVGASNQHNAALNIS